MKVIKVDESDERESQAFEGELRSKKFVFVKLLMTNATLGIFLCRRKFRLQNENFNLKTFPISTILIEIWIVLTRIFVTNIS